MSLSLLAIIDTHEEHNKLTVGIIGMYDYD